MPTVVRREAIISLNATGRVEGQRGLPSLTAGWSSRATVYQPSARTPLTVPPRRNRLLCPLQINCAARRSRMTLRAAKTPPSTASRTDKRRHSAMGGPPRACLQSPNRPPQRRTPRRIRPCGLRGHLSEPDRRCQRCGWYLLESGQAPLAARSSAARRRVLVRA
jgi:hypothetical protein